MTGRNSAANRPQVSQQEVLAHLVETAIRSRCALFDSFRKERVPVSSAEREAFRREMVASGVETIEDGDDVLY